MTETETKNHTFLLCQENIKIFLSCLIINYKIALINFLHEQWWDGFDLIINGWMQTRATGI